MPLFLLVFHVVRRGDNNSMDFNDVTRKRKMIREYDSRQVSDGIIRKLIRNAHRAPSAGHTQVQEFIIVKDPAIKKELRKVAVDQEYVERTPVLIVVCSNTSRSSSRYGSRGKEFYSIIDGAFGRRSRPKPFLSLPTLESSFCAYYR
jgi:nitroreductase